MITNTRARGRRRLCAITALIIATLAALSCAACASNDGPGPAPAAGPAAALREALTPEQAAVVALLDSLDPYPSTAGKAALFVDGGFCARPAPEVGDYVRLKLAEGLPVVLFGDLSAWDALCGTAGAAADLPAGTAGREDGPDQDAPGPAGLTGAARGLRLYPARSPDEMPGSAGIEISGPASRPGPLLEAAITWVQAGAQGPGRERLEG